MPSAPTSFFRILSACCIINLLAPLASCGPREYGIPLVLPDGSHVPVHVLEEQDGDYLLVLEAHVPASGEDRDLAIIYRGIPEKATVTVAEGSSSEFRGIASAQGRLDLRVPVSARSGSIAFRIRASAPDGEALFPMDIRLEPRQGSFFRLDPGMQIMVSGNVHMDTGTKDATHMTFDGFGPGKGALVCTTSSESSGSRIDMEPGTGRALAFRIRKGALRDLAIPAAWLAETVHLSWQGLSSLHLTWFSCKDDMEPIPSDPDLLLAYPRQDWRRKDWEAFRWDAVPGTIIIDFADTGIQDRYAKRLAFFVEKKGFRGSLMTNAELEGRHGWNANNYRAEDLARFFNTARETGFRLNPEELSFEAALVRWGILGKNGDGSTIPAGGGVISVARSLDPATRRLLLNHEALHGYYYSSPGLQALSQELWNSLEAGAKAFILRYFDYYQYDISDPYLMVNEFQAYLMQQAPSALPAFLDKAAGRVGKDPGETALWLSRSRSARPFLQDSVLRLRELVINESGLDPGTAGRCISGTGN